MGSAPLTRLLVVTLAVAASCAPATHMASRTPDPRATVKALRAPSFDRQRAEIVLDLEIENPGPPVEIRSADYELFVQGQPFATGKTAAALSLPSGGSASLTLKLPLAYLDLPPAARSRLRSEGVAQFAARGVLRSASATTAIAFDGQAEISLSSQTDLPPSRSSR